MTKVDQDHAGHCNLLRRDFYAPQELVLMDRSLNRHIIATFNTSYQEAFLILEK